MAMAKISRLAARCEEVKAAEGLNAGLESPISIIASNNNNNS